MPEKPRPRPEISLMKQHQQDYVLRATAPEIAVDLQYNLDSVPLYIHELLRTAREDVAYGVLNILKNGMHAKVFTVMSGIPMMQTAAFAYANNENFENVKGFVGEAVTLAYKAVKRLHYRVRLDPERQKNVQTFIDGVLIGTEMLIENKDNVDWDLGSSPFIGN